MLTTGCRWCALARSARRRAGASVSIGAFYPIAVGIAGRPQGDLRPVSVAAARFRFSGRAAAGRLWRPTSASPRRSRRIGPLLQ
jgi:hypothetical protein